MAVALFPRPILTQELGRNDAEHLLNAGLPATDLGHGRLAHFDHAAANSSLTNRFRSRASQDCPAQIGSNGKHFKDSRSCHIARRVTGLASIGDK